MDLGSTKRHPWMTEGLEATSAAHRSAAHRREILTHVLAVQVQPCPTCPDRPGVDHRARLRGDRDTPAQTAAAALHRTAHRVRPRALPGRVAGRGREAG